MGTRLIDQVAIVTGAGNGIGRSIAIGLAKEEVHICIADIDSVGARQTAQQVKKLKRRAIAVGSRRFPSFWWSRTPSAPWSWPTVPMC